MKSAPAVLCLCGGVGGAKLASGLAGGLATGDLLVVVNTGDDFVHLGLHISPDLDSVMYALAGINDPERGWGLRDESWQFMEMLDTYGGDTWFRLGDRDLATHLMRTRLLADTLPLDQVTQRLCSALGIGHRVVPMSNDPVHTMVRCADGWLSFQDYFVRQQCRPAVTELAYRQAESARVQEDFAAALSACESIIFCPSNPWLSIEPILALPGIRERLQQRTQPSLAVSPVIQGKAVKGPLAKMMRELELPVNNESIARHYDGLIDCLVIDEADREEIATLEGLGIRAIALPTLMQTAADRSSLAAAVIEVLQRL